MLTDIEIAQNADMKPITEIAHSLGIDNDDIEPYGHYKAKLSENLFKKLDSEPDGKLILVTAINPTPAGEGKTTVSVGLAEAMSLTGRKTVLALREPSLGPVFGIKGGAAGGGYSQVVPMEDINLHFTGDMHAITAANNLLCAVIDNHMQQGNALRIDQRRIMFRRCMDMNDRALRNVIVGLGGKINGIPREDGFQITVASEIMAILCLASDLADLKKRFGNILVAYNIDGEPVYARDLGVDGAMTALMKDALKPNLVQTLENNPALIHGGPFANIAHGCNSIIATDLALKLADYVVTEAGFGSDLGMEKFFDIVCSKFDLKPKLVVLVVTINALKIHGGVAYEDITKNNVEAVLSGTENLRHHLHNISCYNVDSVISINVHDSDTKEEINALTSYLDDLNIKYALNTSFKDGQDGSINLSKLVIDKIDDSNSDFKPIYTDDMDLYKKIEIISKNMYLSDSVIYTDEVKKQLDELKGTRYSNYKICISKTPMSISDDPKLINAPHNVLHINSLRVFHGAKFIVPMSGSIIAMPGLNKNPRGKNMKD